MISGETAEFIDSLLEEYGTSGLFYRLCPEGQTPRYRGMDQQAQGYFYQTAESHCRGCPVKKRWTGGPTRRIFAHWHELARQTARELAQTSAYARSKRERNKIEALFSELKVRVGLRRVRLRRLWNVSV